MAHHWRKPEKPQAAEQRPSVLTELIELFRKSFHPVGDEKNRWAMPFSTAPMAFHRRFAGRKHP